MDLWPNGSEDEANHELWQRGHYAMRRAERRLKKRAAKTERLQYPQMPGAWRA